MRVCILASENCRNEILNKNTDPNAELIWVTDIHQLKASGADAYMDLQFINNSDRIQALKALLPATVVIDAVQYTTANTDDAFIRINAWPGFLSKNLCEMAIGNKDQQPKLQNLMDSLGWQYRVVPDQVGMIAARVIAMIINEAYFALGEQVSTKAEIDTAMKLGTNYPFGPFEWAEKIGIARIKELLEILSTTDERYTLSDTLKIEPVQ